MGRKKKVYTPSVKYTFPVLHGGRVEQLMQVYNGSPAGEPGWHGCQRCALGKTRENGDHDIVFASGNSEAKILIIGDQPTEQDDMDKAPFSGQPGRLLNQILASVAKAEDMTPDGQSVLELSRWYQGVSRSNDNIRRFHEPITAWRLREFFFTTITGCRFRSENPRDFSRPPTQPELETCWERIHRIIYITDPWVIISSGRTALDGLMKKKTPLEKARGQIFDLTINGRIGPIVYPVMPTFDPAHLLRRADWGSANGDYAKTVQDYRNAMQVMDFLREKHPAPGAT